MISTTAHRSPTIIQKTVLATIAKIRHVLHNEAMGGAFLLIAACAALFLANSAWHGWYESFLHFPFVFSFGSLHLNFDMHFLANDVLMTLFFLITGVEIRQEIYNGALSNPKQAILPIIAAIGGVCFPAIIYLSFNLTTGFQHGWAVPSATDIAFAVGILALLGKSIPSNLRIVLLSLAVIDDIIAVLIIAFFYSSGVTAVGAVIAVLAIVMIILTQILGIKSWLVYTVCGAVLWFGLWKMGIHPSLGGVVLGLLTPVLPLYDGRSWLQNLREAAPVLSSSSAAKKENVDDKLNPGENPNVMANETAATTALTQIKSLALEAQSPVVVVQKKLHLWVSFIIMPFFAFVNAGVRLADVNFSEAGSLHVLFGVALGLIIGKPLGVMFASFVAVQLGLCKLPPKVNWHGMMLVGLLAGIGFTMAIFVSMLAYNDHVILDIAILGVLCGSAISGVLGLVYGIFYRRTLPKNID